MFYKCMQEIIKIITFADNVKAMLPKENSWTTGKHPEIMDREELEHEIDIFKQQQQVQKHFAQVK